MASVVETALPAHGIGAGSVFAVSNLTRLAGCLGHLVGPFRGAALHLFWRNVFDVRGYAPLMTERVGELAVAVSPKHVAGLHVRVGTRLQCTVECAVYVFGVYEQRVRVQGRGRRRDGHSWKFVADHEPGIADLHLGMHHSAARTVHAHDFLGAECFLVEVDRSGSVTAG